MKIIRRGMNNEFILRRFRHERQALAALDHPNVARLLDGGPLTKGRRTSSWSTSTAGRSTHTAMNSVSIRRARLRDVPAGVLGRAGGA